MTKKISGLIAFTMAAFLLAGCGSQTVVYVAYPTSDQSKWSETPPEENQAQYDGNLHIENGSPQPMLRYSDLRDENYTNEYSDILRFCVYVETDYDTDADGYNDLVKALVQVPRGAVEGKYKAGTIYDPTPYNAGVVVANDQGADKEYLEKEFNFKDLYKKGKKRKTTGIMDCMDAALLANPDKDWNYNVPETSRKGYSYANDYDYYLVRGYAVVEASGIGTFGSEGFELCGTDLERDSHKCVVEWLTGDRVAYTDRTNNIQIKADWANGNIAMAGRSYGGTLPYEVATTGVKGLKTIIPFAGIASWYDYTNSQGICTVNQVNYKDALAAYNCSGLYKDDEWLVLDTRYRSWLWQIAQEEAATNGNYAPVWADSDYSDDYEKINCSALIVHGLNDFNVSTKQAHLMYKAFKKAGQNVKLVLHQNGHADLYQYMINDELWLEIENKWLAHYLYDVDNGIENMPELTVQNNVDGKYTTYDSFGEQELTSVAASLSGDVNTVSTRGLKDFINEFYQDHVFSTDTRHEYYLGLYDTMGVIYDLDIPEGSTVSGVTEVHLKLSTSDLAQDGDMITAVLLDVPEDGELFESYMIKGKIYDCLPTHTIKEIDMGGGQEPMSIKEYVKSLTSARCVCFGWTDLYNPGCGYDSSEYTMATELEPGKYYDYTFYMMPTVYTLEKGHKLQLVITTVDPYRLFMDNYGSLDTSLMEAFKAPDYSFVIDNAAVDVQVPLRK